MKKPFFLRTGLAAVLVVFGGLVSYAVFMGFDSKEAKAGVNPRSAVNLFADYLTWPSSSVKQTGTAAEWLHAMSPGGTPPVQTQDINGDGLADILVYEDAPDIPVPGVTRHYYGIFVNNGDFTFDFFYKCVIQYSSMVPTFYGDCAAI